MPMPTTTCARAAGVRAAAASNAVLQRNVLNPRILDPLKGVCGSFCCVGGSAARKKWRATAATIRTLHPFLSPLTRPGPASIYPYALYSRRQSLLTSEQWDSHRLPGIPAMRNRSPSGPFPGIQRQTPVHSRLRNASASLSCGNCASSALNSRECTQRRRPLRRTGCFRCSISWYSRYSMA